MGTFSSKNPDSAFTSSDDDIIDFRFSASQISSFFKTHGDIDSLISDRIYDIPVGYNGRFEPKLKRVIDNLVETTFSEAESHDLRLEYTDPQVEIYTLQSWSAQHPDRKSKIPNLPASRVLWEGTTPVIELIIPEKITTSEEIIKIARLLFSKIFGKLFFDELVPRKEVFRNMAEEDRPLDIGTTEKAHFCQFLDELQPGEIPAVKAIGKQLGIATEKRVEYGKKELFSQLSNEDTPSPPEYLKILESNFNYHISQFKEDANGYFDKLTDKIFEKLPQTNVILPYDFLKIQTLKSSRQWRIFDAIAERTQIATGAINQLNDCLAYLDQIDPEKPLDYHVSDAWISAINERIVSLTKSGLVKPFLINGAQLTEKQQRALVEFPWWVWKNKLYLMEGKPKNVEKAIQKVISRYVNSTFQKILELSLRLSNCLNLVREDTVSEIKQSKDFTSSKPITAWLAIRYPIIRGLHYTCLVGTQLGKTVEKKPVRKKDAYKTFETGWSYFVSYALVHQYFKSINKKTENQDSKSESFHRVIKKYAYSKINDHPSFQIACLLMNVYEQVGFKLEKVTRLIRQEARSLDFFIMNQPLIFKNQSKTPLAIINEYTSGLVEWLNKDRSI